MTRGTNPTMEERAREWLAKAICTEDGYGSVDLVSLTTLLTAVRDEALEECAIEIEKLTNGAGKGHVRIALGMSAEVIRALKSVKP